MSGQGWKCVGGVCSYTETEAVYSTKAQCEAARVALPPEFTGGQCPAPVNYIITYETRSRNSTFFDCGVWSAWAANTNLIPTDTYYGPIGAPTIVTGGSSSPSIQDLSIKYEVTYHDSSGVQLTGALSLGGASTRNYASSCGPSWEYRNFQVTRADGLPDDCGDLPPKYDCGPPPDPDDPNNPTPGDEGSDPDPHNDPIVELDPTKVTWACIPLQINCSGVEATINGLPSPKVIGNLTGCSSDSHKGDTSQTTFCDSEVIGQIFVFEVRDKATNELIDSRINCCCPTVTAIENAPQGFVCSCPDWGKATSYDQTLFSSSVSLRQWVLSGAGSKSDCKHIMAAKRIMGIDQPTYNDPPYNAPPSPRTPG